MQSLEAVSSTGRRHTAVLFEFVFDSCCPPPFRADVHAAQAPGGQVQHVLRLPALQAGQEDPLWGRQPGGRRPHPLSLLAALLLHRAHRLGLPLQADIVLTFLKEMEGEIKQDLVCVSNTPVPLFFFFSSSSPFSGFTAATSMFTFVVLIITIIICLSHVCFGHFKYLSAHNYKVRFPLKDLLVPQWGEGALSSCRLCCLSPD